jgi:hypothetical protein
MMKAGRLNWLERRVLLKLGVYYVELQIGAVLPGMLMDLSGLIAKMRSGEQTHQDGERRGENFV